MKEIEKHMRPFGAIILAIAMLVVLSLLPWSRLTGGYFKDFNLFSQLVPGGETPETTASEPVDPALADALAEMSEIVPADTAVAAVAEVSEIPESDFKVPMLDGMVMMEDYTRTGAGAVNLRNALSGRKRARIAVIGDSYIEGDIFTQNIRESLQNRYGGQGVGYMPMLSQLTGFRTSVKHTCKNWDETNIRTNTSARYKWLAGEYFTAQPGAETVFKGSRKLANLSNWTNTRLMYIAPQAGTITIRTDAGEHNFDVSPSDQIAFAEVTGTTASAEISTTVPGLVALGAFLDGDKGISVDNMSLRGNSGLTHRKLSVELAHEMRSHIDYDMVVIEFGINALSSQQKDYTGYSKILEQIIGRVRDCYPGADIVLMGIGDRGQKEGGTVSSLATAPAMVHAQREAARKQGVMFWDTRSAMGGKDAVVDWRNRGLVNADYIHLNSKGGKELSRLFVAALENSLKPAQKPKTADTTHLSMK